MRSLSLFTLVIFVAGFLVSCTQPSKTPDGQPGTVTITGDREVVNTIEREYSYDNCTSAMSMDYNLTFKQVLGEKLAKDLSLGTKGMLEGEIPETAKASIEVEIKEQFASEKTAVYEDSQAASFTVPAYSSQKVVVKLTETLHVGDVSFSSNGKTLSTGYSYRVKLEGAGVDVKSLPCSSANPNPTSRPPQTCDPGFDAAIWTPVTTNPDKKTIQASGCWQLLDFGMSMSNGTISFLENQWEAKARWYGVARPISQNAKIRVNVNLAQLTNSQIWIGFLTSPKSINTGKFLVVKPRSDAPDETIQSAFSIEEMVNGVPQTIYDNYMPSYDTGRYSISMVIDINRLTIKINEDSRPAFGVVEVTEPYLFIGYLSQIGVLIDGTVGDIQIEP